MSDDKDLITEDFTDEECELLEKLEETHKRIYPIKLKNYGLVVIRKPTRKEWKRYQKNINNPQVDSIEEEENFCRLLFCFPTLDKFDAVLDDMPAMHGVFKGIAESLAFGSKDDVEALGRNLGKDWKKPDTTI